MAEEIQFVSGLYPKQKHQNAPDFILGVGSINHEKMIAFCKERLEQGEEWTNYQVKQPQEASKKPYAMIDTWKPENSNTINPVASQQPLKDEDIPTIDIEEDVKIEDVPF